MPRPSSRPLLKPRRGRQGISRLSACVHLSAVPTGQAGAQAGSSDQFTVKDVGATPCGRPSSRRDVVGDGPRAVPCDPVVLPLSCSSFHLAHPDPDRIRMSIQSLNLCHADDVARGFLQALVGVL